MAAKADEMIKNGWTGFHCYYRGAQLTQDTTSWRGTQLHTWKNFTLREFWGFHGDEDSGRGLLGCDAV
jgi:hypothetical protein